MRQTKNFMDCWDYSTDELLALVDLIRQLKDAARERQVPKLLADQSLAMIFNGNSTRTRVSFEVAAQQLGGFALYLTGGEHGELHLGKRETVGDTARVVSSMVEGIAIRWQDLDEIGEFAVNCSVPVFNMMDYMHHPTQTLCDLTTIIESLPEGKELKDVKLAFIGTDDLNESSAGDLAKLLPRFGATVTLGTPEGHAFDEEYNVNEPANTPELLELTRRQRAQACAEGGGRIIETHDPAEAVRDADFVYTGCFPARADQRAIIEAINQAGTHVNVGVSATHYLIAEDLFADLDVTLYEMSTNDYWARDSGAIYVKNRETGEVRGVDFKFNSWGGEQRGSHGCMLDYGLDDMVARKMLQATGHPRYRTPFVLEGGSITTDGEGTVITTESCLLNPNRNPDLSREEIEGALRDYLGFQKVIWLRSGVDCEDGETDGHIDDVCAFIGPAEVVCCYSEDESNEYYEVFKDCYETLCGQTDAQGRPLTVHKLTAANPFRFTKEEAERLAPAQGMADDPDGTWRCEGDFAVPSYANFLITNGAIIFPVYDLDTDESAVARMREIAGDRYRVIPVPAHNIALGGGSVHCIT